MGAERQVVEKTHPWPVLRLAGKDYALNCRTRTLELPTAFLWWDPINNYHFLEGRPCWREAKLGFLPKGCEEEGKQGIRDLYLIRQSAQEVLEIKARHFI